MLGMNCCSMKLNAQLGWGNLTMELMYSTSCYLSGLFLENFTR